MNCSKITAALLFEHLSISQISDKYNISKADVVKSIFQFFKLYPNSSHNLAIQRRLKVEITKSFLASNSSTLDFAEEYGMTAGAFRKLMSEIIDDTKTIASDALADKLFKKTMESTAIVVKRVPQRIVKLISHNYACEQFLSQDDLANIYCTRRETIAAILRRGIAENIIDDLTAEKIVVQIRSFNKPIESYCEAFDKREKLKSEQQG